MDTNGLKKFAQSARNLLIDQVTAKLAVVLDPASAARREQPAAVKALESAIRQTNERQVIEQVAYTWFNRFTALRFMDVNGYTNPRVVSPAEGATRPEILAEAMAGNLPEKAPATISALLEGRSPSNDPQAEAYRLLLVHACNAWHGAMPFLFEKVGDYTELVMPEDLLSPTSILARLREAMAEDACADVEIIGWLYQFYISEKKDQVFAGLKKNIKITAENIPAATQLFTPHWIVRYLVENSLGRLWLLNRPDSKLAAQMDYYIAPEEPETDFLKIGRPEEIKICDPACGSGHMLTYAFDLLHAIYEEEGYDPTDIPALILKHNLSGIEIDDRAGALAAFALSMKAAAKLGRRRFLRMEVKPDIVVLQNVAFTSAELTDVAAVVGKDLFTEALRDTLTQFEQAKNFGSLIVPKLRDPAETLRLVEARDFSSDLLLKEMQARVVAVLRMAEALSPRYHVVVANPPYMGKGNMNPQLVNFTRNHFPASKTDLFAMFMERCLELTTFSGNMAMINMQAWMFISSYEKLRSKLLSDHAILSMIHLGERAFDTIGGAVVSTTAFVLRAKTRRASVSEFVRLTEGRSEAEKEAMLRHAIGNRPSANLYVFSPQDFERIPGEPIAYWLSERVRRMFKENERLGDNVDAGNGLQTNDNNLYLRQWFEVGSAQLGIGILTREHASASDKKWFPYNKGGEFRRWYGNYDFVIDWQNDGSNIKERKRIDLAAGRITANNSKCWNEKFYFSRSVNWSDVTTGKNSFRYSNGSLFDITAPSAFPSDKYSEWFLLAFLNSNLCSELNAVLNPTLHFNVGNFRNLPALAGTVSVSVADMRALVEKGKSDWDAYETSWDFTTLPLLSPEHRDETLETTYARLRAHWQEMTDEMQRLEEENNRIFIDAYGLQDELTPDVPIEEITLTCNPAYRYGVKGTVEEREARLKADTMAEFLSYAVGCMFGRYSLDAPGLILANQGETLSDYLARLADKGVTQPSFMPDADNVIPVLDGDWFADDIVGRFRKFLRVTFGEERFRENLAFIEAQIGDIRKYFTRTFYEDHLKRYKKRPIYWMFSSPKGTFQALTYMHRYRPETVSVLLNDYLREFIRKLEAERARLEKLEDDPSASQAQKTKAMKDASAIAKQITELMEWERDVIFPLAQRKIEIDLDDGVKRNYPLFGAALKPIKGLEAADE
ncbi:BREX-1 system adenine-specific DNA-methyltransferase PglX [Agrobacterium pusense]|uniref:BREX-1 system adenine-specific DNA-methyltransferase PglX n=1 Tax=Agrobacterium pusense TaxID=648995 RepID=UPI00088AE90F|nr:BREX-1 system adenine-specific DNA-methyltransferase PglX [Agrobacterium pusense]OOO17902.1 SAM-dependent methyltransferase [Agrobacterium pusense]WKD44362.1 BREX-1 system adenine-specific DNA-methyltransferase PglX [Agrobacterium pusense]SDF62593.1 Type II restriction/modification system, DNA methylase subunit YeeA [Agrobacterium pusense]